MAREIPSRIRLVSYSFNKSRIRLVPIDQSLVNALFGVLYSIQFVPELCYAINTIMVYNKGNTIKQVSQHVSSQMPFLTVETCGSNNYCTLPNSFNYLCDM